MPPRRRARLTAVAEVVQRIVAKETSDSAAERRGAIAIRVFAAFDRLGPPITQHAEPVHYRAGALTVVVDDPTWLTELTFLRPEILTRLERTLGRPLVKELRMRHGRLSRRPRPLPVKAELPKLDPDRARLVEALGELVPDESLRELVQRAARWALGAPRRPK